jgi:hypothetical protein
VRDAVAPDSNPANIPLHILAAEAMGLFNVYEHGLTGHGHVAEAA